MKKIDKKIADAYFREKNMYMIIFFIIWFIVSYCVVAFADSLSDIQILGFPFHYFMGASWCLSYIHYFIIHQCNCWGSNRSKIWN